MSVFRACVQTLLGDAVADSLLGQAQTLFDAGKQDEAEQVQPHGKCKAYL